VWIVRFAKGRWWPGTVEGIETANGLPLVKVRLESYSLSRRRSDPPVAVGLITAPMRRLERRDISLKGSDRPRFVPTSCLREPEMRRVVEDLRVLEGDSGVSSKSIGANSVHDGSVEE